MAVCWEYPSPLTSSNPTFPSPPSLSRSPTLSLCCLNTVTLGVGCMPVQQGILTVYFATSWKTKDVLLGPRFHSLHQLFLSGSHLSQLMAPPVPSHRKWGIRMTRGGYEKGICFTAVGDKITEGNSEGRKSMKERESTWGNEIWDVEEIGSDREIGDVTKLSELCSVVAY